MKFIIPTVLTVVGVVKCQNAIITHPKNRETKIGDGFKCYEKISGTAKGIRTKPSTEVQFFKNDKCEGEWFRKAWGKYNFTESFKYYSIKLEDHKKKEDKPENAEEDKEENGVEEAEASKDSDTSVKSVNESDTEAEEDDAAESEETK